MNKIIPLVVTLVFSNVCAMQRESRGDSDPRAKAFRELNSELQKKNTAGQSTASVDGVKYLIEMAGDLNKKSAASGLFPLYYAVLSTRPELVDILLKAGAQINFKGSENRTALHGAVQLVIDNTNKIEEAKQIINLLLDNGADINARAFETNITPLMQASSFGFTQIVELLLKRNADPSMKDGEGRTALDQALLSKSITRYPTKYDGVIALLEQHQATSAQVARY